MTSGSVLRILREKAGFTQEEVAVVLGVSIVSIQKWEAGGRIRSHRMLSDLMDIYGASGEDRIRTVILMYGGEKDADYINRLIYREER